MRIVDLRSDTLTKPTPGMRKAIADADVGDDVFGEDPTINRLQKRVAELLGKEAALFVPSGTMSNQIAINCLTRPRDEIICEANCHSFNYESGAPALLSGVQMFPVTGERGVITAVQVEQVIRPLEHHFAQTQCILLENTHNRAGGTIFPLQEIKRIHKLAKKKNLRMHLDGARLWNAHVATGIALDEYASYFDTVSVCLSKGLGAPVGSVLVGDADVMDEAHRFRKVYGGGMRQAGILAAAGLYALENHISRLKDDHENARKIAESLYIFDSIHVDMEASQTNVVIAEFESLDVMEINNTLKENGILAIPFSQNKIRFITYLDLSQDDIETAIQVFNRVFGERNY